MMDLKTYLFINQHLIRQNLKKLSIDFALSWKSNRAYNSNLKPSYTSFLHSIKPSRCKMGMKCDTAPLAVEQNNYFTKIVFDGKGEWSFGDGYARNVTIFGVDNSSSSHQVKKILLELTET